MNLSRDKKLVWPGFNALGKAKISVSELLQNHKVDGSPVEIF